MPLLLIPVLYFLLSFIIGGIAGFAYWDFSLLRDLIIVWVKPATESGPVWRTILLIVSITVGIIAINEEINSCSYNSRYDYLPPKINPEEFTISESGQCVVKKDEHIDISV